MSPLKTTKNHTLTITIDGPAGAGKSSAARMLAQRLGYLYLDTGALYRAVALQVIQKKIDFKDEIKISEFCRGLDIQLVIKNEKNEVWVNRENVTPFLRSPQVSAVSSVISALPAVREKLLSVQRNLGEKGGVVAEGRDTGTVVFPDADVKFYLDADLSTRSERRRDDLLRQGMSVGLSELKKDIERRDDQDQNRKVAPLTAGKDTIRIDSTDLTLNEVVDKLFNAVLEAAPPCG